MSWLRIHDPRRYQDGQTTLRPPENHNKNGNGKGTNPPPRRLRNINKTGTSKTRYLPDKTKEERSTRKKGVSTRAERMIGSGSRNRPKSPISVKEISEKEGMSLENRTVPF